MKKAALLSILFVSPFSQAGLEDFYATLGYKLIGDNESDLYDGISSLPNDYYSWNEYVLNDVETSDIWSFGLGYKFDEIKVYTQLEFSDLKANFTETSTYYPSTGQQSVDYFHWGFGIAYEYKFNDLFYADLGVEYYLNYADEGFSYPSPYTFEDNIENTIAFTVSLGFSKPTSIGPFGFKVGQTFNRDVFGLNANQTTTNFELEYPGIIGSFVFLAAGVSQVGGAGYGEEYEWDQFYDSSYNLTWRCRSVQTGRFASNDKCKDKFKSDMTWPNK